MIDDSVPVVRSAVRALLTMARADGHLISGDCGVAVSGGPDSLALAVAAAYVAPSLDLRMHGLVVDHGLQPGSAQVAQRAADTLLELGLTTAKVLPVTVDGPGGMEAAARKARYAALRAALPAPDALVLLGHTRDDQAETVLLGLGRGSGPRSIAGMRPLDPPWARPLLGVSRLTTVAACARLGLTPWTGQGRIAHRANRCRARRRRAGRRAGGRAAPCVAVLAVGRRCARTHRPAATRRRRTGRSVAWPGRSVAGRRVGGAAGAWQAAAGSTGPMTHRGDPRPCTTTTSRPS